MTSITRREAGKILLAGCAGALVPMGKLRGATRINSVIRGVQIGVQSVSFLDRPLDACIDAMREVGIGECELWEGQVVPASLKGEDRRKWRLETPASYFKEIRKKFDDAGILLYAYNYSFRNFDNSPKDFTDEEIDRGFQNAQAMGVKYMTASSNVSMAPRIYKYAQKYKIMVGFHGHDHTSDPDEFSTPETFMRAMKGASPYIGVNLDIGHFFAGGGDPVSYIAEQHEKIVCLHLRDRKKNHGESVPFGQGDTPVVAVLQLLRDKGWRIPANIEYHESPDLIAGVRQCFEYCKKALES